MDSRIGTWIEPQIDARRKTGREGDCRIDPGLTAEWTPVGGTGKQERKRIQRPPNRPPNGPPDRFLCSVCIAESTSGADPRIHTRIHPLNAPPRQTPEEIDGTLNWFPTYNRRRGLPDGPPDGSRHRQPDRPPNTPLNRPK